MKALKKLYIYFKIAVNFFFFSNILNHDSVRNKRIHINKSRILLRYLLSFDN